MHDYGSKAMKKGLKIVLGLLLVGVIGYSGWKIYSILSGYRKAERSYLSLQQRYTSQPESQAPNLRKTEETFPEEAASPLPISVDFPQLMAENGDIVGWLYCPDTPINYPVVQGKDNDYYLHRGLHGESLVSGTLFADYRNTGPGEDRNYILYGHNMKDGSMFASLANHRDQEYYDAHPVIYYLTPSKNYVIRLLFGAVVNTDSLIYMPNPNDAALDAFLENGMRYSPFQSGAELDADSSYVTLSTCTYEYDDARYIVVGRLEELA